MGAQCRRSQWSKLERFDLQERKQRETEDKKRREDFMGEGIRSACYCGECIHDAAAKSDDFPNNFP